MKLMVSSLVLGKCMETFGMLTCVYYSLNYLCLDFPFWFVCPNCGKNVYHSTNSWPNWGFNQSMQPNLLKSGCLIGQFGVNNNDCHSYSFSI